MFERVFFFMDDYREIPNEQKRSELIDIYAMMVQAVGISCSP